MKWKALVRVTLKDGVLDPQGKAVHHGLKSLGFEGVQDVRIGKSIEIKLDAPSRAKAEEWVKQMGEKLLANTVIEKFTIDVQEAA